LAAISQNIKKRTTFSITLTTPDTLSLTPLSKDITEASEKNLSPSEVHPLSKKKNLTKNW
jgi:hypothetical protein